MMRITNRKKEHDHDQYHPQRKQKHDHNDDQQL